MKRMYINPQTQETLLLNMSFICGSKPDLEGKGEGDPNAAI